MLPMGYSRTEPVAEPGEAAKERVGGRGPRGAEQRRPRGSISTWLRRAGSAGEVAGARGDAGAWPRHLHLDGTPLRSFGGVGRLVVGQRVLVAQLVLDPSVGVLQLAGLPDEIGVAPAALGQGAEDLADRVAMLEVGLLFEL